MSPRRRIQTDVPETEEDVQTDVPETEDPDGCP